MWGSVGTIDFLADTDFGEAASALEKLAFTAITVTGQHFVTSLLINKFNYKRYKIEISFFYIVYCFMSIEFKSSVRA